MTSATTIPTAHVSAAETLLSYQWMVVGHLWRHVAEEFGRAGIEALSRGFRRYGQHRGEEMLLAPSLARFGGGGGTDAVTAATPVDTWRSLEFDLERARGTLTEDRSPDAVSLRLSVMPGFPYLNEHDVIAAHEAFWRNVLWGVCEGLGGPLELAIGSDPNSGRWQIDWRSHTKVDVRAGEGRATALEHSEDFISASREQLRSIAAIHMFVVLEVTDALGPTGQDAIRRAMYDYGAERGRQARQQHLATGIVPSIAAQSRGSDISARDPYHALFGCRPGGRISDGLYGLDIYYCPLAEVWAGRGAAGLAAGYLYDEAVHRGLFESYLPGTIVRWDSLKTLGDYECRFRVTAPDLLTSDDEGWLAAHAVGTSLDTGGGVRVADAPDPNKDPPLAGGSE